MAALRGAQSFGQEKRRGGFGAIVTRGHKRTEDGIWIDGNTLRLVGAVLLGWLLAQHGADLRLVLAAPALSVAVGGRQR